MDIYGFINSKAIADHCRKISHRFTPLEMAYIVYANDSLNIEQKHAAFSKIIAEESDMEIKERPWTPYFESLHRFLQKYMELQNKYLDIFYKEEVNSVYSYEVWYSADDDYCKDDRLFTSFDMCYKALKTEIDELVEDYQKSKMEIEPVSIRVKKQWLNSEGDEWAKYMSVCIDYNNVPVEIWDTNSVISYEDSDILSAFEGLWVEIPTPFKKGDILTTRTKGKSSKEPLVLDWIPYWLERGEEIVYRLRESGDSANFTTGIYFQDDDGTVCHDHGPSYLNLEYYENELRGIEKIMLAVSNYVKGELPLELLIYACDIIKMDCHARKERQIASEFPDELLEKAGLYKIDEDSSE